VVPSHTERLWCLFSSFSLCSHEKAVCSLFAISAIWSWRVGLYCISNSIKGIRVHVQYINSHVHIIYTLQETSEMLQQRILFLLLCLALITPALCTCKNMPSSLASPTNHLLITNKQTAATSFCKCTCFTNSTIIPLSSSSSSSSTTLTNSGSSPQAKKATCNDCNRQFCLSYNLPFCKDAKEEDVFTTCFQRDSAKDQLIVCTFVLVTVGLLVWAVVRSWVEGYVEVCCFFSHSLFILALTVEYAY
jgi:hypothetical protein